MASNSNGHRDEEELPTSHLTRPSPDAILADEADPTALLGNESDSEAGSSRRHSLASALDHQEAPEMHAQQLATATGLQTVGSEATPTQSNFGSSKRSSITPLAAPVPIKAAQSESDLRAQIADLTNQVTGLNSKLVNSFMRISDLEDDLSDTQERLTSHQVMVASLEKERQEHLAALNTGLLVEKVHVSTEMQKMMERVIEETAQRGKAISDKEKIEAELDELSSSLFSEANKMVAVEKLARARADEKSKSMEERLRNTEEIMEQQQKRLVELQGVVDKTRSAPDGADGGLPHSGLDMPPSRAAGSGLPMTMAEEEQVKLDIVPYMELRAFLNQLRKLRLQLAPFYTYPLLGTGPNATTSLISTPSGSRSNSPAPGQGRVVSQSFQYTGAPSPYGHTGSVTSSPFVAAGVSRHKDFPSLPSNVEQLIHLPSQLSSTQFLKRINEEDCEPCLRLDFAPGLNWLSRRQMQTAILEGNLLIEPVFGGGQYDEVEVRTRAAGSPPAACAMCGKAILNVPLPGGVEGGGTWISAAGSAASSLQASVANSLPGRDQSASPPMAGGAFASTTSSGSLSQSNTTNSSSSKTLSQKKSSTGLFSSLRSMGASSPRPSLTNTPLPFSMGGSSVNEGQAVGVEEDLFGSRQVPVPTHIFRISEQSTARYLLCPSYCLQRLRVTCDFWGYIRHLERAVVLEGKLAWDDERVSREQENDVPAKSPAPPHVPEKDGASIEEVETDGEAGPGDVAVEAAQDDDTKGAKEVNAKTAEEDVKEKHSNEADSGPDEEEDGQVKKRSEEGRLHSSAGSTTDGTDGEDGFADAQSATSSPDQADEPLPEVKPEGVSHTEQDVLDKDESETLTTPSLPPLPPRSSIRASTPAPPALPPRRPLHAPDKAPAGPEPRRCLPTKGETDLTWEEKVWLEVLRLKADMWSARVGMQRPEE